MPRSSCNAHLPLTAALLALCVSLTFGLTAPLLRSAGNFTILTAAGVSTVPGSMIIGDVGVSPIAAHAVTGFSLTLASDGTSASSTQVVGKVYAASYAAPTPELLTTAIGDMMTAYSDAAGRVNPDFVELAAGDIGGLILVPGVYKWSTSVLIPADVTLFGSSNDVWIFQISGDLTLADAKAVTLAGGAQAGSIFWQVAGQVTIGTTAKFSGIILCKTAVALQTEASMTGRVYAQTAATLQMNAVTGPV